jgi:hypothetical protein
VVLSLNVSRKEISDGSHTSQQLKLEPSKIDEKKKSAKRQRLRKSSASEDVSITAARSIGSY